jgi:protein-L-isoaspartate(D-aspartate) O-methyltransferase
MVDGQLRTSDVSDRRIITAMLELPRERFVAPSDAPLAYLDFDAPIGQGGRRLLKPMVLARLIQAAEIGSDARVLDVGCATGYSSAILARLAHAVIALEQDPALAEQTRENLSAVGADNVEVVVGPFPQGWPGQAPYDAILLNGAAEVMPQGLLRQLRDGGRLVAVVGRGPGSKAVRYLSTAGQTSGLQIFDAAAHPLPGFAEPPAFVF